MESVPHPLSYDARRPSSGRVGWTPGLPSPAPLGFLPPAPQGWAVEPPARSGTPGTPGPRRALRTPRAFAASERCCSACPPAPPSPHCGERMERPGPGSGRRRPLGSDWAWHWGPHGKLVSFTPRTRWGRYPAEPFSAPISKPRRQRRRLFRGELDGKGARHPFQRS